MPVTKLFDLWVDRNYKWCSDRLKFLSRKYNVCEEYDDIIQSYCLENFKVIKRGKGFVKVDQFFYGYMRRVLKIWHRSDVKQDSNKLKVSLANSVSVDSLDKRMNYFVYFDPDVHDFACELIEKLSCEKQKKISSLFFIENKNKVEISKELKIKKTEVYCSINRTIELAIAELNNQ